MNPHAGYKTSHDPAIGRLLNDSPSPRKALFLDRDGVINVDSGYVHSPESTEWIPGIFELCRTARQLGYLLVVVTNQAGIARGMYSEGLFLEYTGWMHREFHRHGAPLAATYYCPHHPTAGVGELRIRCDCRKPAPGMIHGATHDLGIVTAKSLLLGNNGSDMEAGIAAGVMTSILFGAGEEETKIDSGSVRLVKTMTEAAAILVEHDLTSSHES